MSELKRIRVRDATPRDLSLFKKLWMKVLRAEFKEGSIIAASDRTFGVYESLFNLYVGGDLEGIVLFVADKGVLVWGATPSPFEFPKDTIIAWGCYAETDKIRNALLKHAMEWLKDRGSSSLLAQTYKGSEPLEGFEPVATIMCQVFDS